MPSAPVTHAGGDFPAEKENDLLEHFLSVNKRS